MPTCSIKQWMISSANPSGTFPGKSASSSMVKFKTKILQFKERMGEKTGWSYLKIPAKLAQQLKPDNKRSFRVKGKLDEHPISGMALIPMGEGDFILALKAAIRRSEERRVGKECRSRWSPYH